jgi:hypothetical protein
MQIDCSKQDAKHDCSIRVNLDSFSNLIEPIVDFEKHDSPRCSTERGMQTDCSEQDAKHDASIRFNPDSRSIVIDKMSFRLFSLPLKHDFPRILISLQTTTLLNSPKYRIAFQSTKLTRKLS